MQKESTLPEIQAMPTSPNEAPRPVSLLLVDDNPTFLRILRRFLETQDRTGVQVVGTAGGGAEALVMAVVRRPELIVTDLAMPDLHGLELLPLLRRLLPEAGLIALTLMRPESYEAITLAAGADAFVAKTTLESELLPAIQRVAHTARARRTPTGGAPTGTSEGPVFG